MVCRRGTEGVEVEVDATGGGGGKAAHSAMTCGGGGGCKGAAMKAETEPRAGPEPEATVREPGKGGGGGIYII